MQRHVIMHIPAWSFKIVYVRSAVYRALWLHLWPVSLFWLSLSPLFTLLPLSFTLYILSKLSPELIKMYMHTRTHTHTHFRGRCTNVHAYTHTHTHPSIRISIGMYSENVIWILPSLDVVRWFPLPELLKRNINLHVCELTNICWFILTILVVIISY